MVLILGGSLARLTLNLLLRLAFAAKFDPVLASFMFLGEMVSDMVEPLVSGFKIGFRVRNDLCTKSTPEPTLIVAREVAKSDVLFRFGGWMSLPQVINTVALILEEELETKVATPAFWLLVLCLFVPLPVILAAENLIASVKDTPKRLRMAMHVLVQVTLPVLDLLANWARKVCLVCRRARNTVRVFCVSDSCRYRND